MYRDDMPRMRDAALASPDGLANLITFVLLTIQQPFSGVARQFDDVKVTGDRSPYLFGAKRAGYRYAHKHKHVLHAAIVKAVEVGDTVGAIDVLTNVPGLGLVKAGFAAQCVGLGVGCIDTHNLVRFGLKESAMRLSKKLSAKTKAKKIAAYIALCAELGGPEYLWNSWCDYVGGLYDKLPSGELVSRFHWQALGLS